MNLSTVAAGQWTFGINDPSLIAWFIFVAYFVSAFLCWRAGSGGLPTKEPRARSLWTILSVCLILLGLNKQLDLHQLLIDGVQDLVAERAWQNYYSVLLASVIVCLGVLGLSVALLFIKLFPGSSRELRWAYGIFFICLGFQALRFLPGPISSLLVTHVFTEADGLFHMHAIEFLDLASLAWIGFWARTSISGK